MCRLHFERLLQMFFFCVLCAGKRVLIGCQSTPEGRMGGLPIACWEWPTLHLHPPTSVRPRMSFPLPLSHTLRQVGQVWKKRSVLHSPAFSRWNSTGECRYCSTAAPGTLVGKQQWMDRWAGGPAFGPIAVIYFKCTVCLFCRLCKLKDGDFLTAPAV